MSVRVAQRQNARRTRKTGHAVPLILFLLVLTTCGALLWAASTRLGLCGREFSVTEGLDPRAESLHEGFSPPSDMKTTGTSSLTGSIAGLSLSRADPRHSALEIRFVTPSSSGRRYGLMKAARFCFPAACCCRAARSGRRCLILRLKRGNMRRPPDSMPLIL